MSNHNRRGKQWADKSKKGHKPNGKKRTGRRRGRGEKKRNRKPEEGRREEEGKKPKTGDGEKD